MLFQVMKAIEKEEWKKIDIFIKLIKYKIV